MQTENLLLWNDRYWNIVTGLIHKNENDESVTQPSVKIKLTGCAVNAKSHYAEFAMSSKLISVKNVSNVIVVVCGRVSDICCFVCALFVSYANY